MLVDEWDEGLPVLGIVQVLVLQPLVVMARSRNESGLGKEPPDEARERPGHDDPAEPLQPLPKVVGASD